MPEPLTIASTAIAGTRLGISLYKEIKKVCKWLTGNLDSVGRFSLAGEFSPDDLIAKYHEFYIDNTQNQQALSEALSRLSTLGQKAKWFSFKRKTKSQPIVEKLLFQGAPKIGKTRAVYEKVIKRLPDFLVFMPSPAELGKVKSSELHPMPSKRGLILFLDDLDQFIVRQDIDLRDLIYRLQRACPRLLVVATLRTGVEMTDKVMAERHGRDLLQDFPEVNFRDISSDEAKQLAQNIGKTQYEFDGKTPGSVVLGLEEMRHRLESLDANERAICRTLKLLSFIFLPAPGKELIKAVSDGVFNTNFQSQRMAWDDCIKKLKDNDLIRDPGKSITAPHSNYYHYVYGPDYDPAQDLPKLKDIFVEKRDVPALFNLGLSFAIRMDNHQEAITCYDKALEIDPKLAPVWGNKGNALSELGRHEEAIACCDKALEIAPKLAPAWSNKGVVLDKLGRHKEAITCYDKALGIDPKYAPAWHNKGNALGKLGRYEEAITCYDKALGIAPKLAPAWGNKGRALGELGRHKEAITCYDKVLGIDPKDALAWNNKGVALDNLGRYEEAITCYDKALEIDLKDAQAWSNKGVALGNLGRYEDALQCFDKALEINPKDALAWHNKGVCLLKMGRIKEAEECVKRAKEIGKG